MSGVLVLGEVAHGGLPDEGVRPVTRELIEVGRRLHEQGAGPLTVALVDPEPQAHVEALDVAGVEEIVLIASPCEHFEAHVAQAALEALIDVRRPSVVLAGNTVESLGFAAAAAARGGHGFAGDVLEVSWNEGRGLRAWRGAYAERLLAELDFPGKETVVLLLRPGAFAGEAPTQRAAGPGAGAAVSTLALPPGGAARTEHVEFRDAPAGEAEIGDADLVLAIGRGVRDAESVHRFERLAERMGAALAVSGPLVEAGWASGARKVGQSGRTVAPRVYLALGISGAPQHLAGMSSSQTIIAVNSDPRARIFEVAHYGAVADLFDVAAELERRFGEDAPGA
jgi:electron transfer flavoprotein alpha subunit